MKLLKDINGHEINVTYRPYVKSTRFTARTNDDEYKVSILSGIAGLNYNVNAAITDDTTYSKSDKSNSLADHMSNNLRYARIGNKIRSIKYCCFSNERSLKDVIFEPGIRSIECCAFRACSKLSSVVLNGNSLNAIEYNAFDHCHRLSSIDLPDSLEEIGDMCFSNTALKTIKIPAAVYQLGRGCFISYDDYANDNEITPYKYMSNSVMHNSALLQNKTLENVEFISNSKLSSISDECFKKCVKLNNIILPDNLREIGESAFEGCTSLTSINLPSSLDMIKSNAFKDSTNLKEFVYCANLKKVERNYINVEASTIVKLENVNAFANISKNWLFKVPLKLRDIFINDPVWGQLKEHIISY